MDIKEYIEALPYNLTAEFVNGEIQVFSRQWGEHYEMLFDESDSKEYVDEQLEFLKYNYIKNIACYSDEYIEVLVVNPDVSIIGEYDIKEMKDHPDRVCYKVGNITEILVNSIKAYSELDDEYIEYAEDYISLKIYFPSKIDLDENKVMKISKDVLFELSYRYDVTLRFFELPPNMDEAINSDPFYETLEKLETINDNFIDRDYDVDLIKYYYRANIMPNDDGFKYIAYYQVLECIFDEVHLSDTINDVGQIINSEWFSKDNNNHITEVIKIVEQYQKSKNDRDKLRMVLEKYYKGDLRKEAFVLTNKNINEIMVNDLGVISKKDLLDIQKLANILYDVRCEFTHTNRQFDTNHRITLDGNKTKLYIELIKGISERIINNYKA